METIFIVNITEYSFFRYEKKDENDFGYNKLLLELLTPPDKKSPISHWAKTDKIVIAKQYFKIYLERIYNELYLLN
jgi:hypothetical protein